MTSANKSTCVIMIKNYCLLNWLISNISRELDISIPFNHLEKLPFGQGLISPILIQTSMKELPLCRNHFQIHFFVGFLKFKFQFLSSVFNWPINNIDTGNGLVPNRHQAIICCNDNQGADTYITKHQQSISKMRMSS